MEEWKEYKISDVCKIRHGFAFKGAYFTNEKQPYICVTPGNFDIKGGFKLSKPKYYHGPIPNDYILNKDDLIVTMTDLSKDGDTLGYSAIIPQIRDITFLHNQRIGLVESIASNISKHFLYWVMRTPEYQKYIVNCCSGSTVKHTSPKLIGTYVFKAPDPETQEEIASLLNNLDAKIELNRRINDNLEQQAQALFKSWFVDNPDSNWANTSLSEVASFVGGYSYKGEELAVSSNVAMATIKNFGRNRGFKAEGFKGINPSAKLKEYHYVNLFDILVAHTDLTQNADVIGNAELLLTYGKYNNIIFSMDLVKVLPKEIFPYRFLLAAMLKNKLFKGHCLGYINGTTVLHLNKKALLDFEIRKPSNSEAKMMNEILTPYYKRMAELLQETDKLISLRDTLLPKLMSGNLKINDINN